MTSLFILKIFINSSPPIHLNENFKRKWETLTKFLCAKWRKHNEGKKRELFNKREYQFRMFWRFTESHIWVSFKNFDNLNKKIFLDEFFRFFLLLLFFIFLLFCFLFLQRISYEFYFLFVFFFRTYTVQNMYKNKKKWQKKRSNTTNVYHNIFSSHC